MIYTLNRFPSKAIEVKTPYEAWTKKKPNNSHFRIFGCNACAIFVPKKRKKIDKRSKKCIFMGYNSQHKVYMLYSASSIAVFISRDVKFNELTEEFTSYEDLDDLDDYSIAPN